MPYFVLEPPRTTSLVDSCDNLASQQHFRRLGRCLVAVAAACALTACGSGSVTTQAQPPVPSSALGPAGASVPDAFIALATGSKDAVIPWGKSVAYYIGTSKVADLSPAELPGALRACPAGEAEYEGRTCPVSPLDTVASSAKKTTGVVVDARTPDIVGCSKVAVPPGTTGLSVASVRPPVDSRDCFSDFAVNLFTDAAGSVTTIQFVLSGP